MSPSPLALKGALTIAYADEIREALLAALSADKIVTLDVSQATEVDVSFLQILVAAKRSALLWNKSLRIAAPGSEIVQDALACCGFAQIEIMRLFSAIPEMEVGQRS